ncbi:MAG TPA: DUF2723 domain-containing protein [Longimicrobiales bacterium]|nr:DUF2723 domain-containing protein [Longimicrobiales bacterium]
MASNRSTRRKRAAAAEADRPAATGPVPTDQHAPPYRWAFLAGGLVFLLYLVTLAPTTAFWDTSEYIATAHILGIPHPPGNPLFVVFARAWDLLLTPIVGSTAVRLNLFSALMSALAHGFWFLVAHRILSDFSESRTFRLVGAGVAVLLSATAFTVWNQSNVNEKVYTVSLLTIALLSWLAFRWRDNLGSPKDHNLILLGAYILALSVGNHLMAFLAAPALFVFILLVDRSVLTEWRLYAGMALVAVIGLSIHLYLPLRAVLDPVINEVDPSTLTALKEAILREQYDKPPFTALPWDPRLPRSPELFVAQVGNYLQYFDWQWARSLAGNDSTFGGLRPLFTALFTALGGIGAYWHYRRDRKGFAYIAILFATMSLGLVVYLNFKYGYSWARDRFPAQVMHEVRERDYFFIVSFSMWGLWAGVGLAALWQRLGDRLGGAARGLKLASPLLILGFVPLFVNWSWASRDYDWAARDWAYNLLNSVEPYGVLITNGDNDTFPLWYLQEVEGIRRDVQVIVMSYLNTPWYVRQIRDLTQPCGPGEDPDEDPTRIVCQRPYEVDDGPGIYRTPTLSADPPPQTTAGDPGPGRRAPTASIIQLDSARIDTVAMSGFPVRQDQELTAGDIRSIIPAGTFLLPADVFLAHIIGNAIADRPIFFAATTQAYRKLGLDPFLVRQGVAYRLNDGPPEAGNGVVQIQDPSVGQSGEFIDLARTDSLLWNEFVHRDGFPEEWEFWVDESTQGIPFYYGTAHYMAALGHLSQQDTAAAQRHMARAQEWNRLASQ